MTRRRAKWVARIGCVALRLVGATWRVRFLGDVGSYRRRDVLMAFLHGDMLLPAVKWRRIPGAIMISEHGDGEIIAQVVRRLGRHVPVRGSATRGGARAFLEIVRTKQEMGWAITPDGPRGPRGKVHTGIIMLAAEGRRAITPAGFEASSAWRLRSWDRFMVPKPFARVVGYLGDPLVVPESISREQRDELARELERRLAAAHEAAARELANW